MEQTLTPFFALLSILCVAGSLLLAGLTVAGKVLPGFTLPDRLRRSVAPSVALLVFAVTGTAMAGSLYYSEVVGYAPCLLCWYQRIAMYSLVLTALVASIRRDPWEFRPYGLILAIPGLLISIYHSWLQAFPRVTSFCSTEAPCAERHVWEFGFVSIPFMAGSAFLFTIVALSTLPRRHPITPITDGVAIEQDAT